MSEPNKPDIQLALAEAVGAIYFNDGSDYLGALWNVIHALDVEIYMTAVCDIRKAFELTHPEEGNDA